MKGFISKYCSYIDVSEILCPAVVAGVVLSASGVSVVGATVKGSGIACEIDEVPEDCHIMSPLAVLTIFPALSLTVAVQFCRVLPSPAINPKTAWPFASFLKYVLSSIADAHLRVGSFLST